MLTIEHLQVAVQDKTVLKDLNMAIAPGTVHAIMGPNGSGKSTLSHVVAGKPGYTVLGGRITFEGHDLLAWSAHERALAGIFLGFQYPVEIPGLSNMQFLKTMVNAARVARQQPEMDAIDFLAKAKQAAAEVGLTEEFLYRSVNQGFSGGEKKRNEILQMKLLEPRLVILDELDSGLDIDALQSLSRVVNGMRSADRAFVVITHYQRLLAYIQPDVIHIIKDGRCVATGGPELAGQLEQTGYAAFPDQAVPV